MYQCQFCRHNTFDRHGEVLLQVGNDGDVLNHCHISLDETSQDLTVETDCLKCLHELRKER